MSSPAGTPGVYVVTEDNNNNAWGGTADNDWNYCLYNTDTKHPIEFHIDILETGITSAQLLLLCNDVDEDTEPNNPEVDQVYVNDNYVGDLIGANNEDSTSLFNINPAFLNAGGRNQIKIMVNQGQNADPGDWCVQLKRAQLVLNGASGGRADCRYVQTDKAGYDWGETVNVTFDVDSTLGSQTIRVEANIVGPDSNIVAGEDMVYGISGGADDPQIFNLVLPGAGTDGVHTVQLLVFDNSSGEYESMCSVNITVGNAGTPGVYVIEDDNDNNPWGGTPDGDWHSCLFNNDTLHPIEFHIDISETSISSAQLLLLCNDVDEDTEPSNPEIDQVFVNDNFVGNLTGANNEDSTSLFNVNPAFLVPGGRNRIKILVNQGPNADPGDWCVALKKAQLILNGASGGRASCRYVQTDMSTYAWGNTVQVGFEIDTVLPTQLIRAEVNIISPASNIVAGDDLNYTINGSSNDPQNVNLTLPGSGLDGVYTVQLLIFDSFSGEFETECTTTITIGSGGGFISYLPHYAEQLGAWLTELTLANATGQPQSVTLIFYAESGLNLGSTGFSLPAMASITQPVLSFYPSLTEPYGWIKIISSSDCVKGLMRFTYIPAGGVSTLPTVEMVDTRIIFPLAENNATWTTAFAVVNTENEWANMTIYAVTQDGTVIGTATGISVPPNGKYVNYVGASFPAVNPFPERIMMIVESDRNVTGYALSFNGTLTNIVAVPASLCAPILLK